MMRFANGTRIRYREIDQFGRRTRKRSPARSRGVIVGERDDRGALVKWRDDFVGSVLWDWIEIDDDPPEVGADHQRHPQ
jgi:hypothetical protein